MPVFPNRSSVIASIEQFFGFLISSNGSLMEWEVVHCRCFAPSQCTPIFLRLLPLFSALGVLSEKKIVLRPCREVGGLLSPLSDLIVDHLHLFQKGDPFGQRHGVADCLASCSRKFSPLFQLFNPTGKGLCGVVGPHHLHCVLL